MSYKTIRTDFRQVGSIVFLCLMLLCVSNTGALASDRQALLELEDAFTSRVDFKSFFHFEDPARDFLTTDRLGELLQSPDSVLAKRLDRVITLQYDIPFGVGETLRIHEAFTLRSWFERQRRAVLFLNGSVFVADNFAIPVEGYDAMALAARRGMFAFAFDYVGTGESYRPTQGTEASFFENTVAAYTVVWYIRNFRRVKKVDLLGEGYGGAIATQLAANHRWIRSCVMSAMLYSDVAGGPLTDPQFVEFLRQDPDGYFFMPPDAYLLFSSQSPADAQAYLQGTQFGFYPTPNFLVATELPFFDPSVARAPGLAIYGQLDIVGGPNDATDLAAAYGTRGAELVIMEGAGHAPRTDSPAVSQEFWDLVFDFMDR